MTVLAKLRYRPETAANLAKIWLQMGAEVLMSAEAMAKSSA